MKIEIVSSNQIALISPEGSLDDLKETEAEIKEMHATGYQHFLLDMLEIDWVGSSEVGYIMRVFKLLSELNAKLSLLVTSPVLLKTFKTTSIDQLLSIYDSQEQAIAAITAEAHSL